jgi:RNA polymerase sigma factor (sigma-70 family)
MTDPNSNPLLNDLRSEDKQRHEAAIRKLYDMLERVARGEAGDKQGRAGFQPESVVQSVMVDHLQRVRDSANSDGELAGWLKVEVRRKVVDRARHQAVRARKAGDPADAENAPAAGPGPTSIVRHHEGVALDRIAEYALADLLASALPAEQDRVIVDEYYIEGRAASLVAERLGIKEGALRTRASRLRATVMDTVMQALRSGLDGSTWAFGRLVLCNGQASAAAATQIGRSEDDSRSLAEELVKSVRTRYGERGVRLVQACRPRGKTKGAEGE